MTVSAAVPQQTGRRHQIETRILYVYITEENSSLIHNFIRHSMTAKKKNNKKTDNKQETETKLNINSHIHHIKSFRSRLAQHRTELHTELSMSINFVRTFYITWVSGSAYTKCTQMKRT